MGRKSGNINWSDELAVSVRLVGKAILRFFGWVLSIIMTLCLIGVITGVIVGGAFPALCRLDDIDASVERVCRPYKGQGSYDACRVS